MNEFQSHPIKNLWIYLLILPFLLGSCGQLEKPGNPQSKTLQSKVQRVQNPQAAASDIEAQVEGNNSFAFVAYKHLLSADENTFFSPYSLSIALAMTYGGARGQTADQMSKVMNFRLPQEKIHLAFNALDLQINQQPSKQGKDEQPFQLDVANSIWGQQDHPFKPDYLDLLAQHYGAGLRLVDFISNAEGARQSINDWVSEKTQQKILDLIPKDGVNGATRLVLANAIYFKADWLFPFEKANTSDRPFHLLDGEQADVPTMSFDRAPRLPYLDGDGFAAVQLPYMGEEVSMLILLPDQAKLAELEGKLDNEMVDGILEHLQPTLIQVFLPKFEFTAEYPLADGLTEMGMPDAFCQGNPDFSGMDEEGNLCIGNVFHKAFVRVDEKGTEAAAASAVVMELTSVQTDQPIVLNVDRPFIFIIRHNPSGSILFIGRILNPSSEK